jgi:L-lactate dehydrogenase complex protein LldG
MSARAEILSNIRRSLGVSGTEAPRLTNVEQRINNAPRGLTVARSQLPRQEQIALFKQQAESALASLTELDSYEAVPAAVADYLRSNNLPAALRIGHDPRLEGLDWSATAIDLLHGPSDGHDMAGLNHAFAGVAETGTLVMTASAENPTTINFLPDYALVVLNEKDIAGDYESMWAQLRATYGKGMMPRVVNWVTGPSRSGDIEQVILLGAHGPRRLHILMVKEPAA